MLPPETAEGAFEDWLAQSSFLWEMDGYPFWSHLHHAQTWWNYRHLTNIHFVHFSDLLKDIDGEMRKISAFLDIEINEDLMLKRWRHAPPKVCGRTLLIFFTKVRTNAGKAYSLKNNLIAMKKLRQND